MGARGAIVRDLLEIDKNEKYLALAEELLAEYDALLADKPLGKYAEWLYSRKFSLLADLTHHGEKYQHAIATFMEEIRELVNTREDELETVTFYSFISPREPFTTPEGQATHRAWMERIAGRIAVTEDAQNRYGFYMIIGDTLRALLDNNAATEEEFRAHAQAMEAQFAKDGFVAYLHNIHNVYFSLFWREFDRLVESEVITDEALAHLFASALHLLSAGESVYGHAGAGYAIAVPFAQNGDWLFSRLSREQQAFYIETFTALLEEAERVENEWIAAGKPMDSETELTPLRNHLAWLLLPGKGVAFTGTTLDGKPFDIESMRGKIVLLDFWSTTCAPCIAKMPELKELHEKYHVHGFEVVGILVDIDRNLERAVEIIESRGLPWIHLHDSLGELHRKFHGQGVPHCILLDGEGKVILQYARGEALTRKLAELFPGR